MSRNEGVTDKVIVDMYKNGEKVSKISEFAGITPRAVRNVLYKNGFKHLKRPRMYNVNEDFFKTWNNDMAYILGLILTDGNVVNKPNNTYFSISQSNKEFLELIRDKMGSNHQITNNKKPTYIF